MYLRQKCVADYCRYDSDYGKGKTQVGQNIQHLFIFLHTKQPENHLISTVPDTCMNGCGVASLSSVSGRVFPGNRIRCEQNTVRD